MEKGIELPFLPRTSFMCVERSRRSKKFLVPAHQVEFSKIPRFMDKELGADVFDWWVKHASEDTRRRVVQDATDHFRSLISQAAYKMCITIRWSRNYSYFTAYDQWSAAALFNRMDEDCVGYVELDDGTWTYLEKWSRSRPVIWETVVRSASYPDRPTAFAFAWYRFSKLLNRLAYKTMPFVLGRHVLAAFRDEQVTYGLVKPRRARGKVRSR